MINFLKIVKDRNNFSEGKDRTSRARKNILMLFLIHPFNLLLTLALVPLTLNVINETEYGIWLTVSSITTWFIALDFGLGNGLRNKLAEAFAKKDTLLAKRYVSAAYFYLSIISFGLFVLFAASNFFLPWEKILNAPAYLADTLHILIFIVFTLFILNFILKLISFIVIADQSPWVNGLFTLLINFSTVIAIYFLSLTDFQTLLNVGIFYSTAPSLVFFGASIILFGSKYKEIRPSFSFIKKEYASELVSLGFQFFVIQISTLIILSTDNLIIAQIFSPASVTIYNIAYKYFYILFLVFAVILNPFWSAFTDAYTKGEIGWIKRSIKRLLQFWIIFSAVSVSMVVVADFVYEIWVGEKFIIPLSLNIFMALFIILMMWNNIFMFFINGVGKIRLQFYNSIVVGIINIPLSIYLGKTLGLGITGVIIATVICLSAGAVWAPIQYHKIINGKARGIWNK